MRVTTPYPTFRITPHTPTLAHLNRCHFHISSLSAPSSASSLPDDESRQQQQQQQQHFYEPLSEIIKTCELITQHHSSGDKKSAKACQKQATSQAVAFIKNNLQIDSSIIDIEIGIDALDIIKTDGYIVNCLLDAGIDKIVITADDDNNSSITTTTMDDALERCRVSRDRIMVRFDQPTSLLSSSQQRDNISLYASRVMISLCSSKDNNNNSGDNMMATVTRLKQDLSSLSLENKLSLVIEVSPRDFSSEEELTSFVKGVSSSDHDAAGGDVGCRVTLIDPTARELGVAYASCLKSDRDDGLFTTVVVTRCGEALGLVYSSMESIIASLSSPRAIYYSRSRSSLWRKGDTSGFFQLLHRIEVDCDNDALLFTVTQCGDPSPAFCHLKTLTCWGEPRGLRHLEATLNDRLRMAPEGSYTKRLFEDDELLRDKLVEEAQELSEAVDKTHVAEELADVLYFAMVKAVKSGVGVDDAVRELDKRARKVTRRKGDSKAYRIEEGQKILDKVKKKEEESK